MGILDAFNKEDRVDVKVYELMHFFKETGLVAAKNEVLLNGLRADLPHNYILMMAGEQQPEKIVQLEIPEQEQKEIAIKLGELAPVKRGTWENNGEDDEWLCSECGNDITCGDYEPDELEYFYCSKCGAKNEVRRNE